MNKNSLRPYILLVLVIHVFACSNPPAEKTVQTPKDTLQIWADTSLNVLVNEQKKAFENMYTTPSLSVTYMNENDIIKGLIDNKISSAVLHRKLLENESRFLQEKEDYLPKQYIFAYDAYVCITSIHNQDQNIALLDLKNYFLKHEAADFKLALENPRCQTIQFLKTQFSLDNKQVSFAYSNNNLNELLAYLKTNPAAIGMIPFAYISDIESASTVKLLENLKVLPILYKDSAQKTRIVNPSQESITTKEYPLISPLVFVNCNMEKKSGTNFVNYLFKPKAQRLILRCGLCPAIFPGREVNINTN